MALEVEAIYENGVLKPETELPLENGQRVRLTVEPRGGRVQKAYGLMNWTGDATIIEQIAIDPEFGLLDVR